MFRRTPITVVGLVAAALAGSPPASAQHAEVDPGPVMALAAGAGRLVWARQAVTGVTLQTLNSGDRALALRVAPLTRLDSLDVGRDSAARPAAVYSGCRDSVCGIWRTRLGSGTERAVRLPRPPRGCSHEQPVLADRLFVNRITSGSLAHPCQSAGIYEMRGRRMIRRVTGSVLGYDIAAGRIAYNRPKPSNDLWLQVVALRLGDKSGRVILEDGGPSVGYDTILTPQWSGRHLWIGLSSRGLGGSSGTVYSYDARRLTHCRYTGIKAPPQGLDLIRWAFVGQAIYFAVRELQGYDANGTPTEVTPLRRWTSPPPRWTTCVIPR